MDGFKRRLNASIQLKLSFFLSVAIFIIATVAGIFSFLSAFDEAHELQDDTLRQVAALFDRQHLPAVRGQDDWQAKDTDEESRVLVQVISTNTTSGTNGSPHSPLPIPVTVADGMHTLDLGEQSFRVLVKTVAGGKRIAVAQEIGFRDGIARDSALRTLMPFLILIPVLLLIVADLVHKMFRPIVALSTGIDQRSEQELHPINEDHLPIEVLPFIVAINRLLTRVARSMDAQRQFVADAAHELRSPLTAMSLQAERLAEADMSGLARERLTTLRRGIERGRKLLGQLLSFAKAQAVPDLPRAPVSVLAIYRRVLEDLMPLAESKHIDLGVEGVQDAQLLVDELDLTVVVKNLVDNAIRYTPDGGKVDLSLTSTNHHAKLEVKDSGPGIPDRERGRVFDPFYRVLGADDLGAGLGLSIVKAIVDRIGAEIRLAYADDVEKSGLRVSVVVPTKSESRSHV